MRLQGQPRFRADAVFGFPGFFAAARAVRAVAPPRLSSNLRVIDNDEAGGLWRQRLRGEPARARLRIRRPCGGRLDGARDRADARSWRAPPSRRSGGASLAHRLHPHALRARARPCRWA